MKNFGEKGAWAYSETVQIFEYAYTPYYLRKGQSYELQSWQVYSQGPSEQKPLKNLGEKRAWAYPGTAQFFEYPLLSQEREIMTCATLLNSEECALSEKKNG